MAFKYSNKDQGYKLLKAQDLADLTSMSRSLLHRLARDGKFPKPIKIGENRSAWLESDVQEWISECLRKHHAGGRYA
jgi:prophage regulatory protein